MLGVDNVMWANDYPHPDGTWPASQQVFKDKVLPSEQARRQAAAAAAPTDGATAS